MEVVAVLIWQRGMNGVRGRMRGRESTYGGHRRCHGGACRGFKAPEESVLALRIVLQIARFVYLDEPL